MSLKEKNALHTPMNKAMAKSILAKQADWLAKQGPFAGICPEIGNAAFIAKAQRIVDGLEPEEASPREISHAPHQGPTLPDLVEAHAERRGNTPAEERAAEEARAKAAASASVESEGSAKDAVGEDEQVSGS